MDDFEQFCSIHTRAVDCVKKNRVLFDKIKNSFGCIPSVDVLISLEKNAVIMEKLVRVECFKTEKIKKALKNTTPDNILVFIPEIKVYVVFDVKKYLSFIQDINVDILNGKDVSYHPHQLILNEFPQKLIFTCSGDNIVIEKIRKYSKLFFDADIMVASTGTNFVDIIVDRIYANHADARKKLSEFAAYIEEHDDIDNMCVNSKLTKVRDNINYIYVTIPDIHLGCDNTESLLKCIPGGRSMPVLQMDELIENWIAKNPPESNILTKEYHDKFVKDIPGVNMSLIKFNKLVKKAGHTTVKNGGHMRWE
jgi:hypothetical protein